LPFAVADLFPTLDAKLDPDVLQHRLRELRAEGVAVGLMDEALAKVTQWSWTAQYYGGGERVEPLWRERHELGSRVRETPGVAPVDQRRVVSVMSLHDRIRRAKTFREFGRDRDGRLVVSRLVADDPTSGWAWHLGRDASSAEVRISETESVRMAPTATAVGSVRRTSWVDGRIVASAFYEERRSGPQWEAEHYSYRDGALDAIRAWGMREDGHEWSVWPYPAPLRFWTVERGGKAVHARPAGGSIPPQLSDHALEELEHEYLTCAAAALPEMAEVAWRSYSEWITDELAVDPPEHPVCLISIPLQATRIANVYCLRVLTADERAKLRSRRTYKPLDAYLKPEGYGVGAASFSNELIRATFLGEELADELHRRRDDKRMAQVLAHLLTRLRRHDWSAHFPVSDDLLIACIDYEATKRARRAELERSIGGGRFAKLGHEEKLVAARSRATAPAIKLSRARRALLAEIGTNPPAGPGTVEHLWEAFARFVAVPIEGCEPATDGDMILIEWSTREDVFSLSFVRQLTPDGPNDEYTGMYTITVQMTFPHGPEFAGIDDGNAWLPLTDPGFKSMGESLPALQAALAVTPANCEVDDSPV
jgi:hypothetical protein